VEEQTKRLIRPERVRRRAQGSIRKRQRTRRDGSKYAVYRVQVPDPAAPPSSGKKLEKVCYSLEAAVDWRDKTLRQIKDGTWENPREPVEAGRTVRELADLWRSTWHQEGLSEKTKLNYENILTRRVLPKWGDVPAKDIRARDVQQWIAGLSREREPQTVRHAYNVLRGVMRHAMLRAPSRSTPATATTSAYRAPSTALVATATAIRR
jgi:hypothetical protein